MKTVTLTKAKAAMLNRKPLVGKAVNCKPRNTTYSPRGTAIFTPYKTTA